MNEEKPELIKWSSTFSVGIKLIDDQHKGLIDLLNDMFNHVTGNKEEERIYLKNIINSAIEYINNHFNTEEKIMRHTKYPNMDAHLMAHGDFIVNVFENVKDLESGKNISLLNLTKFLKDWVLTHIAIMDKEFFSYFKKLAGKADMPA